MGEDNPVRFLIPGPVHILLPWIWLELAGLTHGTISVYFQTFLQGLTFMSFPHLPSWANLEVQSQFLLAPTQISGDQITTKLTIMKKNPVLPALLLTWGVEIHPHPLSPPNLTT